jgi:hypothetical protein
MSVEKLLKQEGIIYRKVNTKRAGGRQSREWTLIPGKVKCSVQMFYLQSGMLKNEDDGQHMKNTLQLFLEAGADVRGGDRIVIEGVTYFVRSNPNKIQNLRSGQYSHQEAIVDLELGE